MGEAKRPSSSSGRTSIVHVTCDGALGDGDRDEVGLEVFHRRLDDGVLSVRVSSSRSRSFSLTLMPIIPMVRTSPSTSHVSTPGIHVSSPPKSRTSFHTSSGLRSIEIRLGLGHLTDSCRGPRAGRTEASRAANGRAFRARLGGSPPTSNGRSRAVLQRVRSATRIAGAHRRRYAARAAAACEAQVAPEPCASSRV